LTVLLSLFVQQNKISSSSSPVERLDEFKTINKVACWQRADELTDC